MSAFDKPANLFSDSRIIGINIFLNNISLDFRRADKFEE